MGMIKNLSRSIFLCLCFVLLSSHLSFATTTTTNGNLKSPSVVQQAERLIRQLNLFPEDAMNEVRDNYDYSLETQKIVERRFKFPNIIDSSSPSVEDLGHHAGYYQIKNSHAARMFYFFFESRNSKTDPVVIWLTGGPGCSGEVSLFYENGPFSIADDMSLVWNDYGWDQASNIIFVDQPTGTGFSYSPDNRDLRKNEKDVSNDLYDFLQAFFEKHPQFQNNDFYITGESYAGHYIPALASRVSKGNKAKEGIHINLKGLTIGNALTNPAIQYKAYTDYALQMKLIQQSDYERINGMVPKCESDIALCDKNDGDVCLNAFNSCTSIFDEIRKVAGNTSYFDIREQCKGGICYNYSNMEKFMELKSVKDALGVGNIKFASCNLTVYSTMKGDWVKNLAPAIPALLKDGIKLLIYAGEYDLICNWLGNWNWVHAMKWSGQQDFTRAPNVSFVVDGAEAGLLKSYGPLSFLKVHNAGHFVPKDQPKTALEIFRRFTQGRLAE